MNEIKNEKISFSINWLTSIFDFIQINDYKEPYGTTIRNNYEDGLEKLNMLYELLTYPNYDERVEEDKKVRDYSEKVTLGKFIQIYLNGCKNSKGLNHSKLELNTYGCDDFVNRGGSWFDLFNWLYTSDNAISNKPYRIDVGIDVKTNKNFTLELLYDHLISNGLLKYFRNSLCFGSTKSNVYLCIYNNKISHIQLDDKFNYRIEIRFRNEKASWFIDNFIQAQGDYSFIMNVVYELLNIKDFDEFKNIFQLENEVKL